MRKWMSERLKRRKKPGDGSTKEATKAPEPLQPRFYDDEPAAPAEVPVRVAVQATVETPVVESRRPSRPQREREREKEHEREREPAAAPAPSEEPVAASAAVESKPPGVSRRRRSRGGRGRSRSGRVASA